MKNMQSNKYPGNDGLTKKFYEGPWDEIEELLIASVTLAKNRGELSISQRQAITKLMKKNDRYKIYIKIWQPNTSLNVATKIISKALSERLKNVLSSLISTQQTAYLKNRFIGEGGRLISYIVNICDRNNIGFILVTIEIFEYCYLYTAYVDNKIFFLKDENSIAHLSEKVKLCSDFPGLEPNVKWLE